MLQELARSPLMLSVMAFAYQDLPFGDIVDPSAATVENRRKRVSSPPLPPRPVPKPGGIRLQTTEEC